MEMKAKQLTLFNPSDFLLKTKVKERGLENLLDWFLMACAILAMFAATESVWFVIPLFIFVAIVMLMAGRFKKSEITKISNERTSSLVSVRKK